VALDEKTGHERWRTVLPRASDRTRRIHVSPGADAIAFDDHVLLDTATGKVLYTTGTGELILLPHMRFPLLARDTGPGSPDQLLHDLTGSADVAAPTSPTSCGQGLLTPGAYLRLCAADADMLRLDAFALPGGRPAGSATLRLNSALPINANQLLTVAPGAVVAWSTRQRSLYGFA
jgi:hypothetical protein